MRCVRGSDGRETCWTHSSYLARIIHAELKSRAHCRDRAARDLCASGAFRSAAPPRTGMNNPRGSTLRQRTGHPDDAPWSMDNPGWRFLCLRAPIISMGCDLEEWGLAYAPVGARLAPSLHSGQALSLPNGCSGRSGSPRDAAPTKAAPTNNRHTLSMPLSNGTCGGPPSLPLIWSTDPPPDSPMHTAACTGRGSEARRSDFMGG